MPADGETWVTADTPPIDYPLSRETRVGPRGGRKDFALVSRIFFLRNEFYGSPSVPPGILPARISLFQKIFDFPRPFEILLGDVRLDGWIVIIDRGGLA